MRQGPVYYRVTTMCHRDTGGPCMYYRVTTRCHRDTCARVLQGDHKMSQRHREHVYYRVTTRYETGTRVLQGDHKL